jgi:hypothetical protein
MLGAFLQSLDISIHQRGAATHAAQLRRQSRPDHLVATHDSVCSVNIGVLRRPPYCGRHAYDPVCNGFSGLLPVSASSLAGTGVARSQTSGGRSPSAATGPSEAWSRRPPAVGLALPSLAALSEGDDAGQAGNRDPVAPVRIPQILALALAPRWAARRESRDS